MRIQQWLQGGLIAVGLGLTHLCMAQSSRAQEPPKTVIAKQGLTKATSKRLDLRPPNITELFSQETIDRALKSARDRDTLEEVEVEARRYPRAPRGPIVPGGILAPFWALLHPTQAWRILAPLPPDQADTIGATVPDATDPYRAATLPPN